MSEPYTVVYLIENLGVGGIETVLWQLLRGIDQTRYRILPWFLASAGPSFDRLHAAFPETRFLNLRTYHRPGPLIRLTRALRQAQPHLMHTHGYFAGTFGRLIAPWLGLPWVYSLYSHYEDTYRARHYLAERLLARSRGLVVVCSEVVRDFAITRCGVAPSKVVVNYEGVDVPPESQWPTQAEARAMLGVPADAFVVGTVCRLYPDKNVQLLVRASAALSTPCHLLIAGDGPQRGPLKELARSLGMSSRLHDVGHLSPAMPAYRAMDLFVQTSRIREGWSMALVEAMAFGRPVVATAIGGNVEAVTNDVGWLVPSDDVGALQDRLAFAIEHRDQLQQMETRARERYRQRFTGQHMVRGVEAVYERLLAGGAAVCHEV